MFEIPQQCAFELREILTRRVGRVTVALQLEDQRAQIRINAICHARIPKPPAQRRGRLVFFRAAGVEFEQRGFEFLRAQCASDAAQSMSAVLLPAEYQGVRLVDLSAEIEGVF